MNQRTKERRKLQKKKRERERERERDDILIKRLIKYYYFYKI